jgi:hypothetical protein
MRRSLFILLMVLLAGSATAGLTSLLARRVWAQYLVQPGDDLAWLRREFRLSEAELGAIRVLHAGYLPRCRDYCQRIGQRQGELRTLLESGGQAAQVIEAKLIAIGTLRAQCQAAMLQHFLEVSQAMPPGQGQRYLAEMRRLTLGFHERFEQGMAAEPASPHAHP